MKNARLGICGVGEEAGGDWKAVVDELRRKNKKFPRLADPRWRIRDEHRQTFAKLVELFGARIER
ncbi:hypothetical protein XPA_007233 [Xanthoria parietina]